MKLLNMETAYAYIDESGNLKENILVITGIVTSYPRHLEKRMLSTERKLVRNRKNGEIKASKQSLVTRRRFLSDLADSEFEIYSNIFDLNTIKNKKGVKDSLKDQPGLRFQSLPQHFSLSS